MKWFTYCGNEQTGDDKRGYGRRGGYTTHRRRRYNRYNRGHLGLLLHSDDENDPITEEDIQSLMKTPEIETLFPNGYYILPGQEEGNVIITASSEYTTLPDKALLETPKLRIVYDDEAPPEEIDLRTRYNGCTSLIKAVGCEHCDLRGMACLKQSLGKDIKLENFGRGKDEDDIKELLKNRKTKIGAFTYISPRLTIPDRHYFVPSLRHADDHDFSMIDTNSANIGARNKEIAVHQRFKKKHCSVCPVQKNCGAYRSCRGPYPSEAEIAKRFIDEHLPSIENSELLKPWQFWAVARCGNYRARYNRYEITIHGLEKHYRYGQAGWRAVVFRTKRDLCRVTEIDNYEELRKLFPNLPDEETALKYPENWGRPKNDIATALYLRLTDFSETTRRFSAGWGKTTYGILSKRLENHYVQVQYCGARYERHATELKNFADFFSQISHKLGVPQQVVNDRSNAYAYD